MLRMESGLSVTVYLSRQLGKLPISVALATPIANANIFLLIYVSLALKHNLETTVLRMYNGLFAPDKLSLFQSA